jgi:hypothetical protein
VRLITRSLSILSTLLLLAALVLWARGCEQVEEVNYITRSGSGPSSNDIIRGAGSGGGHLFFGQLIMVGVPEVTRPPAGWRYCSTHSSALVPHATILGVQFWNGPQLKPPTWGGLHGMGLAIPYGFIATLLAIAPLIRLRQIFLARKRRWRLAHNLCADCGYDLRASTACCPECGAANEQDRALVMVV